MPWDVILGAMSNAVKSNETEETRRYNERQMEKQNAMNIAQWQRENDYNSPSAQMQRYRKAGLNPDLIYGQQNLSANSPKVESSQGEPANLNGLDNRSLGFMQQMELMRAQSRDLNATAEGKEIDNHNKQSGYDQQIEIGNAEIRYKGALTATEEQKLKNLGEEFNNIIAERDRIKADTSLKEEMKKQLNLDGLRKDKEFDELVRKNTHDMQMAEAQVELAIQGLLLQAAGLEIEATHKAALNEYYGKLGAKIDFETDIISFEALLGRSATNEVINGNIELTTDALLKFIRRVINKATSYSKSKEESKSINTRFGGKSESYGSSESVSY